MCSAIMMGMITCLYEHQRIQHVPHEDVHWHQYGFACIVVLSFSFLFIIVIKSTSMVHRMFAIMAFFAIVGYTFVHLALNQTPICAAILATQFASCANITHWYVLYDDIFWGEVVFILSFFIFYLYNHWTHCIHKKSWIKIINNQRMLKVKEWWTARQSAPPWATSATQLRTEFWVRRFHCSPARAAPSFRSWSP